MRWKTYLLGGILLLLAVAALVGIGPQATITGFFSLVDVAPEGFEFTSPGNVSEQAAGQEIQKARIIIAEMEQRNFNLILVKDILAEANLQYSLGNYTEVLKMAELISFINKKKIEFLDKVQLTQRKEQEFQEQNVDSSEGQALLELAIHAFSQDQLGDAQELLQQADISLEKAKAEKERQKNIAALSKNFVRKYWWQMLLAIILFGLISPPIINQIIKQKRQQKVAGLKAELEKTQGLIKQLQQSCFIEKKISTSTYKHQVRQYEERLAELKHTIPVLEAQLGKKMVKEQKRAILEVKR